MKLRKFIPIVLALLLALSLCTPALAAEEETLTRGEFVSALFELSGVTDMEPKQAYFDDVEMNGDLALAVRWAVGEGIVKGYGNGKFGPDDPVTREQMATMLYRNAQTLGQGFRGMWYFLLDYPDADQISDWADEAMHWCVMNGILIGTDKGLEPKATATDDQLALVLERWQASLADEEDGQNPVMNFIGEYQCDRARALVECVGKEDARITIEWGSSAWELARWNIVGTLDLDTLTIAYEWASKVIVVSNEDGEVVSEEAAYEDGTGTITFHDDGTFTWHEDQSEYGTDMVFEWAPVTDEEDGQNPVMNFIGEYQCDRARALVECVGKEDAGITIEWGSSAWELARWSIVGTLDLDTLTVAYSGCTKEIVVYDENGEVESEETAYEDGTGTITFHDDGTFTWHEDQSEYGTDMVFEWAPVTD